jgi:hypothetical protein
MSSNWLQAGTYEDTLYRAMFLEQMANAMRGSEVRGLQLADRFIKPYETVRPVLAVAVGSLKMNGKTNQVRQQHWEVVHIGGLSKGPANAVGQHHVVVMGLRDCQAGSTHREGASLNSQLSDYVDSGAPTIDEDVAQSEALW